ncbi:TetR/AcrR family transcriptional regulator [Paenibacillus sinopodophylli]|uniref:TetR/AcrR family transcriptional regulator n=1 Tax=Paenibacillus sinopodophylli TaxID=1837342 RepID=UPI001FEAC11E|nr:TetR family transcriptional regulator [Paenibacillus sinopodophylli]
MMNKQSLRDMKREATAFALADAAFALAMEHGMDGFVVEDVVHLAGYSRRTFANHYSCKEEAVASAALIFKGADEIAIWIAGLDEDISPLEMLYHLMKMQLTAEHFVKLQELVTLSKQYPSLAPFILSGLHRLQLTAQETLNGLSFGRFPEGYIHLLVGAVYGAVLPMLDGSLNVLLPGQPASEAHESVTFDHYLDTMFNYLRNGF